MEDVVAGAIMRKHLVLSLLCEATSLQDLKVPIDQNDPDAWIGKQTDQVPPVGDEK
jgi:hypothetical protein